MNEDFLMLNNVFVLAQYFVINAFILFLYGEGFQTSKYLSLFAFLGFRVLDLMQFV